MLTRSLTTLCQTFCELSLYSKVIFKSVRGADDTFSRNSEWEWVNVTSLRCVVLYEWSWCTYISVMFPISGVVESKGILASVSAALHSKMNCLQEQIDPHLSVLHTLLRTERGSSRVRSPQRTRTRTVRVPPVSGDDSIPRCCLLGLVVSTAVYFAA